MVPFTETEHAGKGPGFQLRMLSFRLVELGKMLRNLGKWIQSSGDGVASVMLKGTEGMGYILTLPHPRYGPCQVHLYLPLFPHLSTGNHSIRPSLLGIL